ncbi:MAG: transposase, partial [Gammaproteobacteria bacterium]|nr:transposase [Gammaproteobacteria bacterium]
HAQEWSEDQVMRRWRRLFSIPLLIQRYQKGETTSIAEQKVAQKLIAEWRKRLMDISWYMRSLNEHLARRANEEDQCKGRFWEGRYKSQALLDAGAVLTCMSYVDLNPIRAGIAQTPETSDFTSIQQRIHQWQQKQTQSNQKPTTPSSKQVPLMPLATQRRDPHTNAIGYQTQDYLDLVDWAGRIIRDDKKGYIPQHIPPILQRLKLNPKTFIQHVQGRPQNTTMFTVLGAIEHVQAFAARVNKSFLRGAGHARRMYEAPTTA